MTNDVGVREAHKIATRRAIQDAADRLFDQNGYANTTIREIADAAGVTQRTFFRYFAGKEALLVDDIQAWLPTLGRRIRLRPLDERPLRAVEEAVFELAHEQQSGGNSRLAWLFLDGPPARGLGRTAPRLLARIEEVIAEAVLDRMRSRGPAAADQEFASQVVARCAVAALRSAGLRDWRRRQLGRPGPARVELIRQAFAVARDM
jgi:AcrR family transcriptional regulator